MKKVVRLTETGLKDIIEKVDYVVYDVYNERMKNEDALKLAVENNFVT
jgi:hypothetical protein